MSLLSGIRFVPKEKREVSKHDDIVSDKKDKKRKHEKHRSSDKKDKKKRHEKEKKRDSRHDDSSDSESSVDMEKIAREEEDRERRESYKSRDNRDTTTSSASRSHVVDNWGVPAAQQSTEAKFDPNRFKSLLNSLKKGNDIAAVEQSIESDSDEAAEESAYNYPDTHAAKKAVESAPVAAAPSISIVAPGSTNQSAAAMMRERLKNSKANLASTPAIAPPTNNFASNIGVDRDIVALKSRYNENQVKETSSANKRIPGAPPAKKNKDKHNHADIDVALDINTLKSREKAGAEDIDDIYRDNVLRMGERYMGTELGGKGAFGNGDKAGMDEEGEIDMRMFQRKETSQADALQREANKAMKAQQQLRRAVESCRRCTKSKVFHRNCVVATGENTYLRLKMDPDVLVERHLEIVPISHVSSILQSDEETQVEIERFQSCLRRMYETQGKSVLFLETAVHFHSRPHAHIEVVPVEQGMEAEASMFFKEVRFHLFLDWVHCHKINTSNHNSRFLTSFFYCFSITGFLFL